MSAHATIGSKKELEIALERVERFSRPALKLEQYALPARVAAEILWHIDLKYGDLRGKRVLDLGCGTGILAIGASLLGAGFVVGVDIDVRALSGALKVKHSFKLDNIDFVLGDVTSLPVRSSSMDVVVQNPPFGVHRRGADIKFIEAALRAGKVVYSIHKRSEESISFISNVVKELGGSVAETYPIVIELPITYEFHRKRKHRVLADMFRVVKE